MDTENLPKAERKALKVQHRLEKSQRDIEKHGEQSVPVIDSDPQSIITVLCVRFGTKYGIDYVEKLRNMVSRHITVPYEFVCLTDDPTPIKDVRLIVQRNSGYIKGWWHKVHMFDPHLPLKGRILYMDLDVVICNNIDKLVTTYDQEFLGIRDFNRKFYKSWKNLNSSVMSWIHGTQTHIWTQFCDSKQTAMRLHGDQDWIWKTSKDVIKFFPDLWIQSYKWEIREKHEIQIISGKRRFKEIKNGISPCLECCITVFHGEPNPSDVYDDFVLKHWN